MVKKYGRNNIRSDLNLISEKPIDVLKTLAIDSKGRGKLGVDPPSARSEQSKLKEPKNKKVVPRSKIEAMVTSPCSPCAGPSCRRSCVALV